MARWSATPLPLLAGLSLALAAAPPARAQPGPAPDVADTVEGAVEDSAVPAEADELSRIDPQTVQALEEMFGVQGILVVDDPQQAAQQLRESGAAMEVTTPGADAIQPYSPHAGGGSDWLGQQLAAAEVLDAHQREAERRRGALRMATGLVIVVAILVLMFKKPWESKELPRQAPMPPAPDEVPSAPGASAEAGEAGEVPAGAQPPSPGRDTT